MAPSSRMRTGQAPLRVGSPPSSETRTRRALLSGLSLTSACVGVRSSMRPPRIRQRSVMSSSLATTAVLKSSLTTPSMAMTDMVGSMLCCGRLRITQPIATALAMGLGETTRTAQAASARPPATAAGPERWTDSRCCAMSTASALVVKTAGPTIAPLGTTARSRFSAASASSSHAASCHTNPAAKLSACQPPVASAPAAAANRSAALTQNRPKVTSLPRSKSSEDVQVRNATPVAAQSRRSRDDQWPRLSGRCSRYVG